MKELKEVLAKDGLEEIKKKNNRIFSSFIRNGRISL